MALNRRDFLQNAAKAALFPTVAVHLPVLGQAVPTAAKPDIALRIESATLDIGPRVSIRTIAYNGQVPGPTLRLKEGVPVAFDVTGKAKLLGISKRGNVYLRNILIHGAR